MAGKAAEQHEGTRNPRSKQQIQQQQQLPVHMHTLRKHAIGLRSGCVETQFLYSSNSTDGTVLYHITQPLPGGTTAPRS